jgi:hypothetical protein
MTDLPLPPCGDCEGWGTVVAPGGKGTKPCPRPDCPHRQDPRPTANRSSEET